MKSQKKQTGFFSEASACLQDIRDNCRRNQQADFYYTSYKPLLLELSQNYRRKMMTPNKTEGQAHKSKSTFKPNATVLSFKTDRSNFTSPNRNFSLRSNISIKSQKCKKTQFSNSKGSKNFYLEVPLPEMDTFYVKFLKQLYFAKTKDLNVQPNSKQEKIFLARSQKLVNSDHFIGSDCDFRENSIKVILKYLYQNPVKKLVLDRNPIGDQNIVQVANLIKNLQLRQLSLASTNLSFKGAYYLLKSLIGHQFLESLNISSPEALNRNRINPEGYICLKDLFQNPLCKIHTLNLTHTGMGQKGFILFCAGFEKQNSLRFKQINLSQNQITISEANEMLIKICLSHLSVEYFDLEKNQLGDIGIKIFAHVLGAQYGRSEISISLVKINFSNNNINSSGFEIFCNMIPNNKKINQLIFDNNDLIENQIFSCLRHLLLHTWSIKKLSLRNTLPSSADAVSLQIKALSEGLSKNRSLRQLDLSYNEIGSAGFISIFTSLQENKVLKILKLQGCGIRDAYIKQSQQLIKKCKQLSTINLCNNFIHDKGAAIIIKILSQSHSLIDVSLKKNCINIHIQKDIDFQLKQNRAMKQTQADPEEQYIQYVSGLQQKQRKVIIGAIEQLSKKQTKIKSRGLALQIVEIEERLNLKEHELKTEKNKIQKLQAELNKSIKVKKRPVNSSFLLTN